MLVTGSHSSRVKKSRRQNQESLLRRQSSSPFATGARRKPSSGKGKAKAPDTSGDTGDEPLDDTGVIVSLVSDLSLRDVAQFIQNIQRRMFDDIPERSSGMNSTRIAEVLNYRRSLPPIVTIAHVHAMCSSTTQADREIAELAQAGVVRKITIPNRGAGTENVGEGLVLVQQWDELVLSHPELEEETKENYVTLLHRHATSFAAPRGELRAADAQALARAGFLTTTTNLKTNTVQVYSRPGAASLGSVTSISALGSKAASGSIAAIGGSDVFTSSGASAGGTVYGQKAASATSQFNFALPNTGPYLKLIVAARNHLVTLLIKSSRYKEAPMSLLRERWDGGVASDDAASTAKKSRGEFVGVLPGRTKKWKQFYGMSFDWVLEECVGAGLVECFETRSVGTGVRAL